MLGSAAPAALAQSAHAVVPADKVQLGAAPPILPPGAQLAVLEGNPAEKGPLVLRLKMPANYKIPAHWHTMDERVTVLSGTFNVGMGDKLSMEASQPLDARRVRVAAGEDAPLRLDVGADGGPAQPRGPVRPVLRRSERQSAESQEVIAPYFRERARRTERRSAVAPGRSRAVSIGMWRYVDAMQT